MTSDLLIGLLVFNLAAAAAIAAVIAVRGSVRRRFGPRIAYGLWLAVPVAALAVFIPRPHGLFATAAPLRLVADQAVTLVLSPMPELPAKTAQAIIGLPVLVLMLWLAGVGGALVLTALAHRRGMASFGRLTASTPDGALRAASNGLGPAMVGVLRPRLVLPADFETRFDPREQALILAHEKHHHQCGDVRINGLVSLICCLNWFNPLIHFAAFSLRLDQELACDAAVVERFPGERRTYAEALLKSQLACVPLPLGCTWPGRSPNLLQERLTMLSSTIPGRRRLLAGSIFVGAVCASLGFAAWAAAPDTDAPATIRFACMGSNCAQQGGQNPFPRDPAKIAAAIKAGDGRAVYQAGGDASDVLASWTTRYGPDRFKDLSPGSEQFVSSNGKLLVRYELMGGGRAISDAKDDLAIFTPPPGTPDNNELEGRPRGSVAITEPAPQGQPQRIIGYRAPDGTVLPTSGQ